MIQAPLDSILMDKDQEYNWTREHNLEEDNENKHQLGKHIAENKLHTLNCQNKPYNVEHKLSKVKSQEIKCHTITNFTIFIFSVSTLFTCSIHFYSITNITGCT